MWVCHPTPKQHSQSLIKIHKKFQINKHHEFLQQLHTHLWANRLPSVEHQQQPKSEHIRTHTSVWEPAGHAYLLTEFGQYCLMNSSMAMSLRWSLGPVWYHPTIRSRAVHKKTLIQCCQLIGDKNQTKRSAGHSPQWQWACHWATPTTSWSWQNHWQTPRRKDAVCGKLNRLRMCVCAEYRVQNIIVAELPFWWSGIIWGLKLVAIP